MDEKSTCKLCNLEKKTKWHYVTEDYMIIECETCGVPMAVARKHGAISEQIRFTMEHNLLKIAVREFGNGTCRIDRNMKTCADHFHIHVRMI